MKLFDLISLIFDNLGRRKGRVALTAIGVVIGTTAVVLLVSLAIGFQMNANSRLGDIGDLTTITVYPNYSSDGNEKVMMMGGGGGVMIGGSSASQAKLLTTQALKDIAAIPGVSQVIPRDYIHGGANIQYGRLMGSGNIMGVGIDDIKVFDYPLEKGTTQLGRGQAIIGGWAIKSFVDPKARPSDTPPAPPDLLDQTIKVVLMKSTQDGQMVQKTVNLKVVGILKESRSEADSSIIVPVEDLVTWNEWMQGTRINRSKEGYDTVIVKAADTKQVVSISDQINTLGYQANTAQQYVQGINSFFVIMQIVLGGVGAIALLVAAIGIANTMTMAILERTREIGLMKAIGATNRDVLSIFLGEAAGIGLLGGAGGVALGWVLGQLLNVVAIGYLTNQVAQSGGTPPTIVVYTPAWLPLFALVFATLIGLLSGLYPALRAATLVPVTALKYE
jgi:putative ABC transport system permease protein